MTAMPKITISISDSAANLLESAGVKSAYIERILAERWQDWTEGLEILRQAGWTRDEVLAAADALNGLWLLRSAPIPAQIALTLHDAQALNRVAAKWSLDHERYRERVEAVRGSEQLAWAVSIVCREYWSGNRACEERVEALGG